MYPTEFKGGGFKKIISIVAMIAIPVVAPQISLSMGLSASIGATMGSAVVGGVLGGVASAATGGDWRKGLLGGAIAGGMAGYMSTPTTAPTGGITNAQGADMGLSAVETADYNLAAAGHTSVPTGESFALSDAQGADMGLSPEGTFDYNEEMGFTGGGTTQSPHANALGADANAIDTTDFQGHPGYENQTAGLDTGGGAVNNQPAPTIDKPPVNQGAPKGTFGERFQAGLKNAYSPENLGKASLQMAGNMLTDALVQSDYSAEQQQLIDQRKAEVARLEAQGAEVDKIKLAEARKMLQQAMQVDPTYLARQKANAAKNQAARSTNEAVRRAGASGRRAGLSESIRRRGVLAGGKHSASAFDAGYQGGLEKKIALQKGGVGMLPTSTALGGYYTNLGTQYKDAEEARDKEREGYNQLFGFATTQPGA
jgi:hypothetical protein